MRDDLVVPGEGEENYVLARDARVVTVPFSPLEERMQKEKPEVFARLQKLKEIIGEETFKRLVSKVHNINYADTPNPSRRRRRQAGRGREHRS